MKCEYGTEHAPWWRVDREHKYHIVKCLECGATWRTRAAYTNHLPPYDASFGPLNHPVK